MTIGINSRNIDDLHPTVARGCREFIRRMNAAGFAHVGISSTYRDNVHQDWLFAQGRTRPGNIVTNARGGQSIHNYGLAFDFFQNIRGQEWNNPHFFDTGGRIWQEMGGVWGGSWVRFVDRPHCEYTGGISLSSLQSGIRLPLDSKMLWEAADNQENSKEVRTMRYNTIEELPLWARPTVEMLVKTNRLQGEGEGRLNLSEDMLRLLVINDRAGLY
ncbi:MAG: M15 family metallopeptidase [Defluviitaleaceae bacterium]|nr:M15 family metallopeptidase [Defluviitaleaceae bacterium]